MNRRNMRWGIILLMAVLAWLAKSRDRETMRPGVPTPPRTPSATILPEPTVPTLPWGEGGTPAPRAASPKTGDSRQTASGWKGDQNVGRHQATETLPEDGPPHPAYADETRNDSGPRAIGDYRIADVTVVDISSGTTISLGEVDLAPTLERIKAGKRYPHRNDGSVYRNFSRALPNQPAGYYREYVVPTEGVSGPGPQRLIIGQKGEMYYTFNHYDTFIRVEGD